MSTRVVISATEVDDRTGAGVPGTGGVTIIETFRCPRTCVGSITRVTNERLEVTRIPCPYCG